ASDDRPASRLHWVRANVAWSFALFARKPKFAGTPLWRAPLRLAAGTAVAVAVIAATMIVLDAPAVTAAQRAPAWLPQIFDHITQFGKSVLFFVAIALSLGPIAFVALPGPPAHVATRARCNRGAARVLVPCDRSAGLGLHHWEAPGRPRATVCRGKRGPAHLPPARLERRICQPAVRPCRRCVRGRHGHRRPVA